MLIVGGKDADAGTVSVRHRTEGDIGSIPLDRFIELLRAEVASHGRSTLLDAVRAPA